MLQSDLERYIQEYIQPYWAVMLRSLLLSKMSHGWIPSMKMGVMQFLRSKTSKPWITLWRFSLKNEVECIGDYFSEDYWQTHCIYGGTPQFRWYKYDDSFILIYLCTWFITSLSIASWCAIFLACSLRSGWFFFLKAFKENHFSSEWAGREKDCFGTLLCSGCSRSI